MSRRVVGKKSASKKPAKASAPKPAPKPKRVITIAGQPTRFIREIKIGERHRKDMGDLDGLAKSIDDRGALLQPVVIDKDNVLIAGQRRIAAWPRTKFRREPIPVTVVDIDAIVAGEWDENAKRKDFTLSECVSIMEALRPIAEAKAKERQIKGKKSSPSEGFDAKGNASDLLAEYVGKDRKTLARAKEVLDAADRDPERFGKLVEDMNRTGRVNGPHKRLSNIERGDALRGAPPPLPMNGPYHTIAIDFPWEADLDGHRDTATRGYYPYATMSLDAICDYAAREIAPILQPNCAIWLFIPNFHLVRGCHVRVLDALGVQGSTMLTGVKPKLGQGQRLRGATEHAILAIRGDVPVLGTEQGTWFDWEVKGAHSAKPQAFFEIVEKVTPAPRYAFLFAGGTVPENWDGHGDRIGKPPVGDHLCPSAPGCPEDGGNAIAGPTPARPVPSPHDGNFTELQALEIIEAGREIDIKSPIVASLKEQKLARGSVKLKLTKAGMVRLEALRREEYSKSDDAPPPDRGDDDQVEENNLSQVDCRVCSLGAGLCVECIAASDHVITEQVLREFDDPAARPIEETASCSCGFECRVEFVEDDGYANLNRPALENAVKAHWQNVVTEAKAASSSVAESDPLDIPECLRRAPAEAAE